MIVIMLLLLLGDVTSSMCCVLQSFEAHTSQKMFSVCVCQ